MNHDLSAIRSDYTRAGLSESDLAPHPLAQLERWVNDAIAAQHPEPTAMALATVSPEGVPACRIVLLKEITPSGLVFFTSYESEKAKHMHHTPIAGVTFFWVLLERQVRVSGTVSKVAREQSEAYFRTRPRPSQLGAWASPQSAPLTDRAELERRLDDARARFGDGDIPCPPTWGGFCLNPTHVEFWQGRPSRLHDRVKYTFSEDNTTWTLQRLAP